MTHRYFVLVFIGMMLGACSRHSSIRDEGESTSEILNVEEGSKIVTLNGTATEIVAAAGFADRIVGADVTSVYPEAIARLPRVGYGMNIQAEGVLSLGPELVMGNKGGLKPEVETQLRLSQVALRLYDPLEYTVAGAEKMIRDVTRTLDVPEKGEEMIRQVHIDLQKVVPFEEKPKVLFIYARGAGTLMVGGDHTQTKAVIELAGAENAVSGFNDYMPLTPEALVAANPDAVLLFSSGIESLDGVEGVKHIPGMKETKAGKNNAYIAMDASLLSNFGPRLGQAAWELNKKLHRLTNTD